MKLRDILNRVKNSSNNQSVWNPKKRKLKEIDMTEDEVLDIDISKPLKRYLKDGNS